jgi:hypothetical protein
MCLMRGRRRLAVTYALGVLCLVSWRIPNYTREIVIVEGRDYNKNEVGIFFEAVPPLYCAIEVSRNHL